MSARLFPEAKFRLGRIVATPSALLHLTQEDINRGIARHQSGDWGDIGDDDRRENEESLKRGSRVFSVFHAQNGTKFWIITEADRSSSTVLLPEDY